MVDDDELRITELFRAVAKELAGHATVLMGGDREEAQDLVQVTFQALVQRWEQLRGWSIQSQRAWLWRVAANQAVNAHRRKSKVILVNPFCGDINLDQPEAAVDRVVVAKELLDQCWAIVRAMPPRRRLVIVLHAYGASTAEIADRLGIDSATVRWHRAFAVRELSDALGHEFKILYRAGDGGEEGA